MGSETVLSDGEQGGSTVRDVVRDVVAETAPEELPLVAGLAGLDDATVVRRLGGRSRRNEQLGFGLGEIAALVTPVVWLALHQMAQRLAAAAVDEAAHGAKAVLRKVLRRTAGAETIPPLTREQLGEVRELVLASAAQRGLGERRASVLADTVVARLALAPGDPGPEARGIESDDEE
jgi:hypothetical protein